jgi:hypothetical protein
MHKYKKIAMPTQCHEFCPTLAQEAAVKNAYRNVSRRAVEYLAELLFKQSLGKLIEIDSEHVAALEDELAALLAEEGLVDDCE